MKLQPAHIGTTAQRGASMIELMITMLLGLFLMAGVLQLFSSNKTTYSNMEGISQIQENARAGLERIKDRVRMAGCMGCSNLGILEPKYNSIPKADFSADTLVKGNQDADTSNDIVDGTDILTVISTTLEDTSLETDMAAADTSPLSLLAVSDNLQSGSVAIITDCENADLFQVTAADSDSISHSATLSKPYLASSTRIMSLQNMTYSVETTPRTDESGAAVQSLYETPAGGTRVEIMTGVEDMRVSYGEDTDNDGEADQYTDSTVSSGVSVVSVRLRLLVSTGRAIGPALRPYVNLDGVLVSEDRRMRRTFTTTISLRNRS